MKKIKILLIIVGATIFSFFVWSIIFVSLMPDHEVLKLEKPEFSEMRIVEKFEYYDIYGSTEHELREEMYRNGPYDPSSLETFFAFTDFSDVKMKDAGVDIKCGPYVPDTVEVTYVLPNWVNKEDGDKFLNDKWNKFIKKLTEHEKEHGQIGIESFRDMENIIYETPVTNNCIAYHLRILNLVSEEAEKNKVKQIEFDRITDHGQDRGASF